MQTETLEVEIARLGDLNLAELRGLWAKRLGKPRQLVSTELTRRWLAWELQAALQGGLDAGTRRRLRQLMGALRSNTTAHVMPDTSVKPGTVLTKEWAGTTHKVLVLEDGFNWNGRIWSSLSEIAFRITGTRWSGPRFFGLKRRKDT